VRKKENGSPSVTNFSKKGKNHAVECKGEKKKPRCNVVSTCEGKEERKQIQKKKKERVI